MKRIDSVGPITRTGNSIPQWELANACYHVRFSLKRGCILTPDERKTVLGECLYWRRKRYQLFAVVVMRDHVHMVLRPLPIDNKQWWSLSKIVGSIKGYTARRINTERKQRGSLWMRRCYSRILRTESDLSEKVKYVVNNPVKAGLTDSPFQYPYLWIEGQPPG